MWQTTQKNYKDIGMIAISSNQMISIYFYHGEWLFTMIEDIMIILFLGVWHLNRCGMVLTNFKEMLKRKVIFWYVISSKHKE